MKFMSLFIVILCARESLANGIFDAVSGYFETGERGDRGDSDFGDKGDKGRKGEKGKNDYTYKNLKGDKGDVGEMDPGPPGTKGDKGYMGPRGPKGDYGDEGVDGLPGITGPPGEEVYCKCTKDVLRNVLNSIPEMRGPLGDKGISGEKGTPGILGPPGVDGIPGVNGIKACTAEDDMKSIAAGLKQLSGYYVEKLEQLKILTEQVTKYNERLTNSERYMTNLISNIEYHKSATPVDLK